MFFNYIHIFFRYYHFYTFINWFGNNTSDGFLFFKLFYRLTLDGIAGVRFFLRGEWQHLFSVLKAHISMYTHLPYLLRQRRNIA